MNMVIIITKYTFIALPGLKSNKFIRFVDKAIIKVFTIISVIFLDMDTDIIRPTKPPNSALNPPVVSFPFKRLLKCPFRPLTSLFPIVSSIIPAKNIAIIPNINKNRHNILMASIVKNATIIPFIIIIGRKTIPILTGIISPL
ncbi:hypothetical protein SDC9_88050 [bioreactor metagenome]|uniref:Uncharacterized protein n=1 Tax=bioreactor metagenome TaxID=1076179 RepID=A0A644ZKH5_9ZZZZ